ncbi:acyl--CoA ligase [Acidiferrimicrobium sp. IK]|uniref:class I adenylate-forming enzyme family protein n=1 Tax=Acidiferrimicrobium sp. IK TaxID=2871700 RepID=UPI0021CB65CF|nr:class I adenylate-forming enzyme family protein [Acidiferrimicrobium sp. IK]MCU4184217.1 acyl--CoA ligase [Acidiferrimicrobium sp. IK]
MSTPKAATATTLRWAEDEELEEEDRARLTGPGAVFEMVDLEVLGTTVRGFARRPRSVAEMLLDATERFGERPFLVFPARSLSFAGLATAARSIAGALRDRYGVGPGDRVAIAAANVVGQPLTAWAVAMLGGVVVELNGWWTGEEMHAAIALTEPVVVVGDRRRLERLDPARVGCPLLSMEDQLPALEGHPPIDVDPAVVGEDDPLAILFTSGTSGRPKGVVLSHRAHVHMVMQASLQGAKALAAGRLRPPAANVTVGVSPMFHVSGFTTQVIGGAYTGATYVYPPPGRWDERTHLRLTEGYRATAWSLVPTQLWRLLECPELDSFDLSSLTRIGGGGATFDPELWRQVRRRLGPGVRMATGYGMSETCGSGTHLDGTDADEHPDSLGRPGPGSEIRVVGLDGRPLPDGEVGQICLRGPATMVGYWADQEATDRALDADRWYRTGEWGHIDGGLLYLDGRGSELIVRGGENVYPIEIENVLLAHPDIVEAAVVGVAHRTLGEEVAAAVVARPGARLERAEVRAWVAAHLAAFKVPSQVILADSLPRNAAGKVLKRLLVSSLASG